MRVHLQFHLQENKNLTGTGLYSLKDAQISRKIIQVTLNTTAFFKPSFVILPDNPLNSHL